MPMIGFPEFVIVLVIALLVFGPKKLPELGRSLGTGMREFKEGVADASLQEPPEARAPRDR